MSMFQERRILEETVTHLTPTGLACQQLGQTPAAGVSSAPGNSETVTGNAPLQVNGHSIATASEGQHASKLHFFHGTTDTVVNVVQTSRKI